MRKSSQVQVNTWLPLKSIRPVSEREHPTKQLWLAQKITLCKVPVTASKNPPAMWKHRDEKWNLNPFCACVHSVRWWLPNTAKVVVSFNHGVKGKYLIWNLLDKGKFEQEWVINHGIQRHLIESYTTAPSSEIQETKFDWHLTKRFGKF